MSVRERITSVLAIVLSILCHTVVQAQPVSSAIAFASSRDGNLEIYLMSPNGLSLRRLTNNPSLDANPSWSPSGKQLAFASDRSGDYDIYRMSSDGTNLARLTSAAGHDSGPIWSPDGIKIAFRSLRDGGQGEVYVMNADGSNQVNISNHVAEDSPFSWSPDGQKLLIVTFRDGNGELYSANPDGSNLVNLTNHPANEGGGAAWSPDGTKIAFSTNRDGNYEIYVMNANGSNQSRLTNNLGDDYGPAWSPDGSSLTFYSNRDGNYEIYVMNSNGTNQTRLTNNAVDDVHPSWSPLLPQGEYSSDASTVLLLHMNELSTLVYDASGKDNNGTATGTTVVDGRFGKARRFNGITDYLRIPHMIMDFNNAFTWEGWVYIYQLPSAGSAAYLLSHGGNPGSGLVSPALDIRDNGKVDFYFYFSGTMLLNNLRSSTSLRTGVWYHLASIYTTRQAKIFINGVEEASAVYAGGTQTNANFYVGAGVTANAYYFDGIIDEVRISNKDRSPGEFNLQLPPTNVRATASGTTINLSWQNGGGGIPLMRYNIYRGLDSTNVLRIASLAPTDTNYADTGLSAGTRYFYRVSAVDSTGFEGAKSYAASVDVPLDFARISIDKTSVDFGSVPVGGSKSDSIKISNTGTADLIVQAKISGADSSSFTVSTTSLVVRASASAWLSIHFSPQAIGGKSSTLLLATNDSSNLLVHVRLTAQATPTPKLIYLAFDQIDPTRFPSIDCYVSALDSGGRPIPGLTDTNFVAYEDGRQERPITVIPLGGTTQIPISVALVIDRSGSMLGTPIQSAKNAASTFVDSLRMHDRGAVVSFSSQVTVDQSFTDSKTTLKSAIASISASGATAIYDAVYAALTLTAQELQRKAVVLLTDGEDNSSIHTISETIDYANRLGIAVHGIGLGLSPGSTEERNLKLLTRSTGGRYYYSPTPAQLGQLYQAISLQLQQQYRISYLTHDPSFNGTIRTTTILASYRSSSDTASRTYRAPSLAPPKILRILDVPNDNGRRVFVLWRKAQNDGDPTRPVAKYSIWRRDFTWWTFSGDVPAVAETVYAAIASTIYDSTKVMGIYWSVFRVVAHGTDPTAFASSFSDSGYSVDNLIPSPPTGLKVLHQVAGNVLLTWQMVLDPDIQYFIIHRSPIQGFVPDSASALGHTTDTSYTDRTGAPGNRYFYRVVAVDFSGNHSLPSEETSIPTGIPGDNAQPPSDFSMIQNYPNPFNPSTTIRYALPSRSVVRLEILNVLGQQVQELVNSEQEVGYHQVEWHAPAHLSSGVYFYRVEAIDLSNPRNHYVETKKMLLLR